MFYSSEKLLSSLSVEIQDDLFEKAVCLCSFYIGRWKMLIGTKSRIVNPNSAACELAKRTCTRSRKLRAKHRNIAFQPLEQSKRAGDVPKSLRHQPKQQKKSSRKSNPIDPHPPQQVSDGQPDQPRPTRNQKKTMNKQSPVTELAKLNQRVQDLEKLNAQLLHENNTQKLELELLECTTASSLPLERGTPSNNLVPKFTLVLIDGDAYQWSSTLASGSKAASNVKSSITSYLLSRPNCPATSTHLVRVLRNKQRSTPHQAATFMQQFTEFSPLYDFCSAGTGKERVDSKIHALLQTFIYNPSCVKVFLGVGTDNGFARSLEGFVHDAVLKGKIVIIDPGFIVKEIDVLGFETVEWPSVFARRVVPLDIAYRRDRSERVRLSSLEKLDTDGEGASPEERVRSKEARQIGLANSMLVTERVGVARSRVIPDLRAGVAAWAMGTKIVRSAAATATLPPVRPLVADDHGEVHACAVDGID